VLATVEFHDHTTLNTQKINDKPTDRLLPTELETMQPAVTQMVPKPPLGLSHRAAEMPDEALPVRRRPHEERAST